MNKMKRFLAMLLAAVMVAGMFAFPALADDDGTDTIITIYNPIPGFQYYAHKVFDLGEDGKYTYTSPVEDVEEDILLTAMLAENGSPFTLTLTEETGVYDVARKSDASDSDVIGFFDGLLDALCDELYDYTWGDVSADDNAEFSEGSAGTFIAEVTGPGYYYIWNTCDIEDVIVNSKVATVNASGNTEIFEKSAVPQWGSGDGASGKGIVTEILDKEDPDEDPVLPADLEEIVNIEYYDESDYSIVMTDVNSANIGEDILFRIVVDAPTYVKDDEGNINLVTWYNISDVIESGFSYSFLTTDEDGNIVFDEDFGDFGVFFSPITWENGEWTYGDRQKMSPYVEEIYDISNTLDYQYQFEELSHAENNEFRIYDSDSTHQFQLHIPFGTTYLKNAGSPYIRFEVFYRARLNPDAENVKIANLADTQDGKYDISNDNTASFSYHAVPFDPDTCGDYDYLNNEDGYPDDYPEGDPVVPDTPRTTQTYTYAVIIEKYEYETDDHLLPGAQFSVFPSGSSDPIYFYKMEDGVYIPFSTQDQKTIDDCIYWMSIYDEGSDKYRAYYELMEKLKAERITVLSVGGVEGDGYVATNKMNGVLVMLGLAGGTYTVTETKAPEGYRVSSNPNYTVIPGSTNFPKNAEIKNFSYNYGVHNYDPEAHARESEGGAGEGVSENELPIMAYKLKIDNSPVTEFLPETGGTGTKLFLLFGSLTALSCAVLLVTNHKMRKQSRFDDPESFTDSEL